jgi:hypothetical protein
MGWVNAVQRDVVDLFQVRNEKAAARNVRLLRLEIGKDMARKGSEEL